MNGVASGSIEIAERELLAAFLDGEIKPSETGLRQEDFSDEVFGFIYKACQRLEESKRQIGLVNVADEMGDEFLESVTSLCEVHGISKETAKEHASVILKSSRLRQLTRIFENSLAKIKEGSKDAFSIAQETVDRVNELIVSDDDSGLGRSMLDVACEVLNNKEKGIKPVTVGTGIKRLDDALHGGFEKSNLVVIGARPAVGKSALMLWIALNSVQNGMKVLYLSREMNDREQGVRTLAKITGWDMGKFNNVDEKLTQEEEKWVANALRRSRINNLTHICKGVYTVSDLRRVALQLQRRSGLDMICVDYVGLMNPEKKSESRVNDITQITNKLKELASELDVVVLAASQLNRETKLQREPTMENLRDSGSVEQDANTVMLLYQTVFNQDKVVIQGDPILTLEIVKQRQGPCEGVYLRAKRANMQFIPMTKEEVRNAVEPRPDTGRR